MFSLPKITAISVATAIAAAGFLASADAQPAPERAASPIVLASLPAATAPAQVGAGRAGSCDRQTWPYLAAECMAPGASARKPVRTVR